MSDILIYKDSKGELHEVPSDVPVKLGKDWTFVEVKHYSWQQKELDTALSLLAKTVGVTVDEIITKSAAALGIKKCPSCQMRSQILQKMGQLGFIETARRLRATFKKDA